MSTRPTFVIIGAGLAGAKAAEALRDEGFEGRVVLIGDEPLRPYERPPLSKAYLRGEASFDEFAVHGADFYDAHAIELFTSTRCTAIDPAARQLSLDPGGRLDYDQLLLAPGATPRTLEVAGADLEGIFSLRSLATCDLLRAGLAKASRVAIVGAGWIGAEVAASARQMGKDVVLVEAGEVPLERALGVEVGRMFRDLHADNGVVLRMGTGVESFRGHGVAEEVVLSDGSSVRADLFVVGVGVLPNVELAREAGVVVDNGIVTDQYLESSVPGIYAAGDVANAWHPRFGVRMRLEHWATALNQGPVAARNMSGRKIAYDQIPYFFSDQYDLAMEVSGVPTRWDQVVYRGDPRSRELIVFWLADGCVVAGMNVNVWDVADDIAELVRAKRPVDLKGLADPETPLSSLISR